MNIASIITLICLVLIGLVFRTFLYIKFGRDENPPTFRNAPRRYQLAIVIYALATFGAAIWLAYELLELMGLFADSGSIVYTFATVGTLVIVNGWIIYYYMRPLNKRYPQPSNASPSELLEWENQRTDAGNKLLFKVWGLCIGSTIVIMGISIVILYFIYN